MPRDAGSLRAHIPASQPDRGKRWPLHCQYYRHQREVGAGWFDAISVTAKGGASSTTALNNSTEEAQFTSQAAQ